MNLQNVNYTVTNFVHAYKQAPWRIQRQWIGTFLLTVLGFAMVAALYLDVTAQAAISGRTIQNVSAAMIAVKQNNADLETQLAQLTSNSVMEQRAKALGYVPVDPSQIEYVIVPGYAVAKPAILSAAPALKPSALSVPSEYTESLIDWFSQRLNPGPTMSMSGLTP
jgi:hypothetical protein